MKSHIITAAIIFFNLALLAQSPPDIQFKDVEEDWLYISEDTTFIQSPLDPYSSPFWGRHPIDIISDQKDIYILELVVSQSPYTGYEGTLMHKLNRTGIPQWINYNTTYVGNVFREAYFTGTFKIRQDGNLEISGYRDIDTIDFTMPDWTGFFSNPIKRIIDRFDGSTIQVLSGQDSIRAKTTHVGAGLNRIYNNHTNSKYQLSFDWFNNTGNLINKLEFYPIDDNMNLGPKALDSIIYETNIDVTPANSVFPKTAQIGTDTLLILFGRIDTSDVTMSPNKLFLEWYDVSSIDNVSYLQTIDVRDDLYFPQDDRNGEVTIRVKDNNIFLSQNCYVNIASNDNFYWLRWLDQNGNERGHVTQFSDGSGNYYEEIRPIGIIDNAAYFINTRDRYSFDIVKLEAGQNIPEIIGNLEISNTSQITRAYVVGAEFISDQKLLLSIQLRKNNNQGRTTTFTYYYSFDRNKFGIPTATKEKATIHGDILLFPNPASSVLNIDLGPITSADKIIIHNTLGRKEKEMDCSDRSDMQFSVDNLIPGTYFLQIVDKKGRVLRTGNFIKE